ncbi:MAG TPA: hypothetical protein VLC46_20200 [Thermoanaerobaculia bacterium]|jgi:hypothetical protein|nr:hypothetical protein [Thermoanaerobaculia bacterium]
MSDHVVAARFQWDDANAVAGMQRDAEATRLLNQAIAEGAPAAAALAQTLRQLTESTAAAAQAQSAMAENLSQNTVAIKETAESVSTIESNLATATEAARGFIEAFVASRIVGVLKDITMAGVEFNAQLEESRLGLGALTNTFGTLYDATGQVLKGNDAYNASMLIGADIQDKLKLRALSTTLQYSQLLDVMQRAMPQMMQHLKDAQGFVVDDSKLVDFAATFAQGARTAGLGPEEIGVNLQRFLQGTADPRHARFAAMLLNTIGPTPAAAKEQMQQWEDQGVLWDKLTEKLAAFKHAGEDAMNQYTGALTNLKDAWQQLLGEGTSDATKSLTTDMLALRDALVTIDTQGHATFNENIVAGVKGVAGAIVSIVTAAESVIEKFTQPGGLIDAMKALIGQRDRLLNAPGETKAQEFVDIDAQGNPITQDQMEAQSAAMKSGILDHVTNPFPWLNDLTRMRPVTNGSGFFGTTVDGFTPSGKSAVEIRDQLMNQWLNSVTSVPPAGFLGSVSDPKSPFNRQNTDSGMAALLGGGWNKGGFKITTPNPGEKDDGTAAANKLDDFKRFMEQFNAGAGAIDEDPLAQKLNKLTVDQNQAWDNFLKLSRDPKLQDAGINWTKALDNIDETFANRRTDAIDKYNNEFTNALQALQNKIAPAGKDDPEAKFLTDKLTRLEEIDALMRKFPDKVASPEGQAAFGTQIQKLDPLTGQPVGPEAAPGTLELAAEAEYDKKVEDARDKSLEKIDKATLDATRKTAELKTQIEIDATDATEKQNIETIVNSIDRQLATKIAANDKWAAEQDKTAKDQLHATDQQGLLNERLANIEAARQAKNKLADDEATRQHNAENATTLEWLNNLDKRREEVIPKIGITLQDTIIGALTSTQSAIDQFFANIAAGNANLGSSADALVHDLGQKWSKVFADALSAPLHGGSILTSFSQISGAFSNTNGLDSRSLDGILAGAGIGSFIGGAFGPGNKAAAGGSIGGGIGAIAGGIIGSALPGLGTAIGAELGSVLGSLLGAAIGSTMSTTNWEKIVLQSVTLSDLRGPQNAINNGGQVTDPLGNGGSISFGEKGLGDTLGTQIENQIRAKVADAMKSYQSILDLFPEEVQAQLAKFNPSISLTDTTNNVGKFLDLNGAMSSLSDFFSNQLPQAAFSAYEPALAAGLAAMGEGQQRIAQVMAYWGTLQGTELHDAVLAYVTALVKFASNKSQLGDPTSAITQATKNQEATPLSQLQDQNSAMALVVASLPKLVDVSDQLAAMQQLNTMSDTFFQGLVAAFQKIDDLQKQTNTSLDSFNEQVNLAGMTDQQKMDYYYKQMGSLETQLQVTKDPDRVAAIVAQIEQYGQAALSLAPDNADNRAELLQISDEVRNLAGTDYAGAQANLLTQQQAAYTLLSTAANTLLKASNDLMGRAPGAGRSPAPGLGGGGGNKIGPHDPTNPNAPGPNLNSNAPPITAQALTGAFRTALDDKPIAISTDNGVALIVAAVDRVSTALGGGGTVGALPTHGSAAWRQYAETTLATLSGVPSSPAGGGSDSAPVVAAIKALQDEMRLLRTAVTDRAVVITGDGAEFLRAVGFGIQDATITTLRAHPELLANVWD